MNQRLFSLISFLSSFGTIPTFSQDAAKEEKEQLFFGRYTLTYNLPNEWQIEQEIEERAKLGPLRHSEFRLRSHLIKTLGAGWSADGAFLFSWEKEAVEPYRDEQNLRMEFRLHQQISYQHTLGQKFSFEHSYRIEQRFFEKINDEGLYEDEGMEFEKMRYRYELTIGYKLNKVIGFEAFNEIVLQSGPGAQSNPFDRNESGASVNFTFSNHFGIDINYKYRYNPEGIGSIIVHQHIFQLVWNQTINPRNSM